MNLAVDIGGTYLRYDINGVKKIEIKNIDIEEFLKKLIKKYNVKKIAISFAGQVYKGEIFSSPNAKKFNPKNLKIPYILENDLNCAALAQSYYFKSKFLVALYSGTGVGSGIIENGKIIRGYKNLAGEIGHIPYKKAPFKCGCGKDNCIELFASGSGIEKWAKFLGCEKDLKTTCKKIKQNYEKALLFGVATVLTLFNPEILVLGGGVIKNNPYLVKIVKENIKNYAPSFAVSKIVLSELEEASLKGAKLLLKDEK